MDDALETTPKPERYTVEICGKDGAVSTFELRKGSGLSALRARKSAIEFDCLDADCGICVVRVLKHPAHLSPTDHKEKEFLTAMRADLDERLACQCRVFGDVTLKVEF